VGPGYPTINEAGDLRRLLRLEDDHVVVYWDQVGCGLSARAPASAVSVDGMRDSAVELIELLGQRFGKPIHVIGYSQGAAIAAMAVAMAPRHVAGLILVSPDVRAAEADAAAYAYALDEAKARDNERAMRELERIGPPPHLTSGRFGTRAAWIANFGGVSRGRSARTLELALFRQVATSRAYWPLGVLRAIRAIGRTQDLLLPELARIDLFESAPRLDVPVSVLVGRLDRVADPSIAERYVDRLRAPRGKALVWFDDSAHLPQYDEPTAFGAAVRAAVRGAVRSSDPQASGAAEARRAGPLPHDTVLGSGA
jgi:pimeloyl-ACP methyl ester carboxylesterase